MAQPNRLGLFVLLLGILLLGLTDVQIISPILPKLAQEFSVSPAVMGTAVSAYAIAAALWALLVGPLSDQIGRLIFLRAATWIFASAAIIACWAQHFQLYVAARVLAGLAGGTISACVIAQVADLFDYSARGRAMGGVGVIYFIAPVLAVPLGTWMTAAWGWRNLYLVFMILALAFGLLMRPSLLTNRNNQNPAALSIAQSNFQLKTIRQQLRNYPRYFMQRATRLGLLLAVTISAAVSGLLTYLGLWLTSAFGMSVSAIGFVFMLTGAASVAGAVGGGWMSDRLGKRKIIALSSLLLVAVLLAVNFVQTRDGVFVFCAAGGLAMAVREGPFQALISELVQSTERGAYIALRNATSQLAIAATAVICGLLFERSGFPAVAYFAAGCSVIAGAVVLLITEPVLNK